MALPRSDHRGCRLRYLSHCALGLLLLAFSLNATALPPTKLLIDPKKGKNVEKTSSLARTLDAIKTPSGAIVVICEEAREALQLLPGDTTGFTIVAHDPAERFLGPGHCEMLYAAVPEPKTRWVVDGGHGTDLLTPAFARRVEAALRERLAVPAP